MSQYYQSSKYISNLLFVMPYTYILDDSIKLSPTLILTADHSTLLFLPGVFYKIKNFFFLQWVNLYMIRDTYLHDPPPFNSPFFMTPPFSAVSRSCDPPSVSWFFTSPFISFIILISVALVDTCISCYMCSPTCTTHIQRDMFFLTRETHIHIDMSCPTYRN